MGPAHPHPQKEALVYTLEPANLNSLQALLNMYGNLPLRGRHMENIWSFTWRGLGLRRPSIS